MLLKEDGVALLQRLLQVVPEGDFLELTSHVSTIMSHPAMPGAIYGDPKMLLILLRRGTEGAEQEARMAVDELKGRATISRDQEDRAFFAKSTVFYAIASGFLQLYKSIVSWMRRFLADYRTVKTIFSHKACHTNEGLSLLRCIPKDLRGINIEDIRKHILEADSILLDLLDAAVASLQQPSFYRHDWVRPLSFSQKVTMGRVAHVGRLKTRLQLSEVDIYSVIWIPTMETLVRAEKTGLEHPFLCFNSPNGPLCYDSISNDQLVKPKTQSSYRFLNNLAKDRDSL